MRRDYETPMKVIATIALSLSLLLSAAFADKPDDPTDMINKIINQRFPGAVIKEIEQEIWNGQPVTEVELTTRDGVDYEVLISESGEILSIKEEKGLPWIGGKLSLGLAIASERSIYKGMDSETEPAPFFLYENGRLEIQAYDDIGASWTVYGNNWFNVALFGYLSIEEGYDPDDSDYLEGMDELDDLYGAGVECELTWREWELGLDIMWDLSDEHDGHEAELSLSYSKTLGGFILEPSLSLTWMSEKTVDYFYGVSESEKRDDRPAYSPGSSYEIGAQLMIRRHLFGNFTAVGLIEVSTFGSEIRDSPLVDEDYEIMGAIGIMYTF